jgi:hypothetical protein
MNKFENNWGIHTGECLARKLRSNKNISTGKGKDKVHPRTGHEGPEGE